MIETLPEYRKALEHRRQTIEAAVGGGAQLEVGAHGLVGEDAPPLRHQGDAVADHAPRRLAAERAAGQRDAPAPRSQHSRQRAQQRRLAAAVRADDRDDLALADRQGEVVQHLDLAVIDDQVTDLEQAHAGAPR